MYRENVPTYLPVRTILGRVLAAFVVGTATLLLMKPDPEMHWATPPANVIRVARDRSSAADQLRRRGLRVGLYVV